MSLDKSLSQQLVEKFDSMLGYFSDLIASYFATFKNFPFALIIAIAVIPIFTFLIHRLFKAVVMKTLKKRSALIERFGFRSTIQATLFLLNIIVFDLVLKNLSAKVDVLEYILAATLLGGFWALTIRELLRWLVANFLEREVKVCVSVKAYVIDTQFEKALESEITQRVHEWKRAKKA